MAEAMPGDMMFTDTRPGERHGRRRRNPLTTLVGAIVLLLSVGLLAWWWRFGTVAELPAPRLPATATTSAPPEVAPVPVVPAIRHPVEIARTGPLPALHQADRFVAAALEDLLGRSAARAGVVTDGFLQRFVSTIDNLARDHAAPSMWPVQRAAGRFTVEPRGEGVSVIASGNAQRYTPFVHLLEKVDMTRAALLYRRLYPLFQQSYEEVGFPGAHFNDRLVDVIDHLLAAPEPDVPVVVRLVEVHGPVKLSAPWRHYEFVDPHLEALSGGQKLMVRIGPDNERRVKAVLTRARTALVGKAAGGDAGNAN